MDSAACDSNDLILRIVGGQDDKRLLSVKRQRSLVTDRQPSEPEHPVECCLERSGEGVFIRCQNGVIEINGETCQSDWLVEGDQIQVGSTRYEVQQLGMCLEENANENPPDAPVEPPQELVNALPSDFQGSSSEDTQTVFPTTLRFEKIEEELERQNRHFAAINQRLDQLACQLSSFSEWMARSSDNPSVQSSLSECHAFDLPTDVDGSCSSDLAHETVATVSESTVSGQERESANAMAEILSPLDVADPSDDSATDAEASLSTTNSANPQVDAAEKVKQNGSELEDLFASLQSPESDLGDPEADEEDSTVCQNGQDISTAGLINPESEVDQSSSSASHHASSAAVIVAENSLAELKSEPAEHVTPGSRPEFQAESVADVLARMNGQVALQDDMTDSSDDSSSVQDYMDLLLQRLNSQTITTPLVAVSDEPTTETASRKMELLETAVELEQPLKPNEFKPKRVAPEVNSNLKAMRELANATTRCAVQSSETKRRRSQAQIYLLLSGGGVVAAIMFFIISRSVGDLSFLMGSGLVVISIACATLFAKANLEGDCQPDSSVKATFDWKWPWDARSLSEIMNALLGKWIRNPEADK